MSINLSALMKQRYDTAANWTAQNPTLLAGEIGIESDTKKWKVGTGATAWTSLVYAIGGTYPIVNADVAAAAAIVDTKLATIATAGKVSNSATTAASANTASAIVARDASGNFTAGTITAALTGAASSNVLKAGDTMTGVLAVTAGTAALPGIAVSGDPNTGIYSPGADQLAISTDGTEKLIVKSNGNVGIGNSSPAEAKLCVNGGISIEGTYSNYKANILTMDNNVGNSRINSFGPNITTPGSFDFIGYSSNVSVGATRMFISSAGAVGIGTSSPGSALEINAAAATSPFIAKINTAEAARIDDSGRLLAGTSSSRTVSEVVGGSTYTHQPNLQLESAGSSLGLSLITNRAVDATGPFITLGKSRGGTIGGSTVVQSGDELGNIYFAGADGTDIECIGAAIFAEVDGTPGANDMPGRLVFSTTADGAASPTERMRLTNDGYLRVSRSGTYTGGGAYHEIDTDAANWTLQVRNSNASPFGLLVNYAVSPNNTSNDFIYCNDNTSLRATIRSNGGLANFSANNANLSDRNVKKDISPAADTWNCLKEWEIVNYRYKDQPDDADLNLGVIAQQVAESCPEVITVFEEAKDDQPEKLGVKEQQMYWMAIKALQEAQVRIEALEADVAQLKGE
jgi:hypothetical protein